MYRYFGFIICFLLSPCISVSAQSDTLLTLTLDTAVEVSASRLPVPRVRAPYSIHRLGGSDWQSGRQQLSLAPALQQLPGLVVLNPNNFAQDLRLSVRGFGARSAFGIRGIQIWVDGLPETTPDGQGQVDNLDGGLIESAELMSEPASGMYGNAAGGVIQLQTALPPDNAVGEAQLSFGSFGAQRYSVKGGGQKGAYQWLVYGSHTRQEGYRAHSATENTLFNGRLRRTLNDRGHIELLLNYVHSPIAQDPGGLSAELMAEDRRQAWARNLLFDAGESVDQGRAGLTLDYRLNAHWKLEAYTFLLFRDFSNRLPFENGGAVSLNRQFGGGGGRLRYTGQLAERPYRQVWGIDLQDQQDDRERFNNLEGIRGAKVFDQLERFRSIGFYTVQEWQFLSQVWLTAALRYDANNLSAEDAMLTNGDDSGDLQYHTLSPSVGLSYEYAKAHHGYVNYSYSFETPTLSELSANPSGAQGFNEDLDPQYANNYEVGIKGVLKERLRYQLSGFFIRLSGERLPFELADSPGRVFYRNAGSSRRQGVESWLEWSPVSVLKARLSYVFSDFIFEDYEVEGERYDGNLQPSVPRHLWSGMLQWNYNVSGQVVLEGRYMSEIFVNDSNSVSAEEFLELNLRMMHSVPLKWGQLSAFGGVNNLLDTRFVNNVRLNAFGGRYFEAAPGRNFYFGLQFKPGTK
ncbi:MAG: TonB-dependent receptor [Phaeodactylibacter sp.]|nr:TonB-dependent receptor [Phaeodactylibacter sp.]